MGEIGGLSLAGGDGDFFLTQRYTEGFTEVHRGFLRGSLSLAGRETGIFFVTNGTAQANVKMTIEWDLSKSKNSPSP